MANKMVSPTSNDPATLAFSAVEDALKDSLFGTTAAKDAPREEPPLNRLPEKRPERERIADRQAAMSDSVANDDRFGGARIMRGATMRTSNAPTVAALVFALGWIGLVGAVAAAQYGARLGTAEFWRSEVVLGLVAIAFLPALGFLALAQLSRRAEELRNATAAVAQAAMRMAEPETEASEKVASVGQAVRREVTALGDGLERALSRAGELEVMIHNEVTALERTYADNESRMRALIQELVSQRGAVTASTENIRETVADSHKGLITELGAIGQSIASTLVESGGHLTKTLAAAGASLNDGFGTQSAAVAQLLESRSVQLVDAVEASTQRVHDALEKRVSAFDSAWGDRATALGATIEAGAAMFEAAVDQRIGTFDGLVAQRTQDVAAAFDDRARALTEALDGRAVDLGSALDRHAGLMTETLDTTTSMLVTAIEDRTATLATTLNGGGAFLEQLSQRGDAASAKLSAVGQRMADDIAARGHDAETAIDGLRKQLDETIAIQLNAMESRLQTSIIEFTGALDESSERARITLTSASEDTLGQFDGRISAVSTAIDAQLTALDSALGDKGERLIDALETETRGFAERADVLVATLDEKSAGMREMVDRHAHDMAEAIAARASEIDGVIARQAALLTGALDSRLSTVGSDIDARVEKLGQVFDAGLSTVADELDRHNQQMASTVGLQSGKMTDTLKSGAQQLSAVLTLHTEAIAKAIGERTADLAETIDAQSVAARDRLDSSIGVVSTAMTERTEILADLIERKVAEANDAMGQSVVKATSEILKAESGLTSRIDGVAARVADGATRTAEIIDRSVDVARQAIVTAIDGKLGALPGAITARAELAAEHLDTLNTAVEASLNRAIDQLDTGAKRLQDTISTQIVAAAADVSRDVAGAADHMGGRVAQALQQIDRAARAIDDVVSNKGLAATEAIEARIGTLSQVVTIRSEGLLSAVEASADKIEIALRVQGDVLQQALAENAEGAERLMAETSRRILIDADTALTRLNQSNQILGQILESANSSLAMLEGSVADQTASYSAAVNNAVQKTDQSSQNVSRQVNALHTTVRGIIEDFTKITGNLHDEVQAIDRSTNALSLAGHASLSSLEDRRTAMDDLAEGFAQRADEIDARMRSFAQTIADTVNATERRLADARDQMGDVLATSVDQLESALVSTRNEVQGALAASAAGLANGLQDVRHATSAETQKAAEFLRQTQATIIHEAEKSLEDATRRFNSTAAAMRHTAKEMSAELDATRAELARGVIDLPEEVRVSAAAMRRVVAEQIEALNELNAVVRAQPATHDVTDRRAPSHQASLLPAPVEAPRTSERRRAAPPAEHISAPLPRPAETPRSANKPAEAGDSWLRNVLRNANTPAVPAQRPPSQPDLAQMAGGIAQAIDPIGLTDAWRRYQTGEANAFSRRLYTLKGQGIFDQVKQRLGTDPDFVNSASLYMGDLEQQLQGALTGNDPASDTLAMLTSERGKVYTMLAHASGRLG